MATSVFTGLPPVQLHYLKAAYLASLDQLDQKEAELKTQMDALADMRAKVRDLMRELDQNLDRSERPQAAEASKVAEAEKAVVVAPRPAKPVARRARARAAPKPSPG